MDASVAYDQHSNKTEASTQATFARAAATNTTATPASRSATPTSPIASTTPHSTPPPATAPNAVAVLDSRATAVSPAISNASSASYNSPTDFSLLHTSDATANSPIPRTAAVPTTAPAMSLGSDSAAVATLDDMKPKGELLPTTQKIKKCALRSKNFNFRKITRRSVKNLQLPYKNAAATSAAAAAAAAVAATATAASATATAIAACANANANARRPAVNNIATGNGRSRRSNRNAAKVPKLKIAIQQTQQALQQQQQQQQQTQQLLADNDEQQQQQQPLLYTTTKEKFLLTLDLLAVVRRNASDKLRLIHMVRDNPILWDSRMPNFKGAEEEKNRAWEQIGKEFNAPGRRVARAFKSLRESYRRELAHVKLMGSGFKPKWSLYEAMDFLRDVIRERKGGSHAVENAAIGFSLSAYSQQLHNNNNSKSALKYNSLHSLSSESALNLSKCASLNMSQDENYYGVKAELDMATPGNGMVANAAVAAAAAAAALAAQHPMPAHQHQQQQTPTSQRQQLQHAPHDSRVTSTRNDSITHNSTFEDMDASSGRSGDEGSVPNAGLSNQGSDEVEELEAIDADFPFPLILDSNSPRCGAGGGGANGVNGKRKHRGISMDGDGADEDDDYEGQMLQQHRHLRQQNGAGGSGMSCMMDMAAGQTVREVLNSKFCGFISAKLNSMEDTEADNLMNKILMLLVQTQSNNEAK